ncbi:MAG: hypothetical protein ACE5JJ_04285 [Nitrospinota bacterium]
MVGPGVPREELLEHLAALIRGREQTRTSLDQGIRHLRQLEIEMQARLLAIDRERTGLEERFHQDLRRREGLAQEETRLQSELDRAREQLQALADIEGVHQRGLEELAHQEQLLLLEYEEKVTRAKECLPEATDGLSAAGARSSGGRFEEVFTELPELEEGPSPPPSEEVERVESVPEPAPPPPPGPASMQGEVEAVEAEPTLPPEPAPPAAPSPPPASAPVRPSERLARHFQEGGAIRLYDGEGELCLAFLLGREGGKAVLSVDSFLGYLRRRFRRIYGLHEERLKGEGASTGDGATSELKATKEFLARLAGALETGQVAPVLELSGTRVQGESPPGVATFEYEKATAQVLNGRVMALLSQLLRSDPESFFAEGGPYSEIAEYLNGHLEYVKGLDEEERGEGLLAQLGLDAGMAEQPKRERGGH